jgi:hypothetical protein
MSLFFSIELESKKYAKNISISDEAHDRVFFEGDLGSLSELSIIDNKSLEVLGSRGTLRIELDTYTLKQVIDSPDLSFKLYSDENHGGLGD